MSELTKGPWKAKRLATYQEPGWVVLWPDKGGTHMRRLDSNGKFTGPDAALIAAAHELLAAGVMPEANESLRAELAELRRFRKAIMDYDSNLYDALADSDAAHKGEGE